MTDYTNDVTSWYKAIQYRSPPAAELATFNAQLQAGIITPDQAIAQIEASSYTQSYVNPVIREYEAAFGRVPDQGGVAYWSGLVAGNPNALATLSTIFANSAEFNSLYAANATTPANATLVAALYQNVLGRPADTAGLTYWSNQNLNAAQLLQAFAQSAEYVLDTNPYVIAYQNLEVLGTEPTTGPLFNVHVPGGVATYNIGFGVETTFTITGILGGQPVSGTVTGGPTGPITGTNNVIINAPSGLNDFQNIVLTGTNNVLNAFYGNSTANFIQSGLNLQGIQTWNINAATGAVFAGDGPGGVGLGTVAFPEISFTGDAAEGNVIKDLRTVNFNDNSGITSLFIGDNSEPVQQTNGADGFAINVFNATGTGDNGVDVDIAAQAFTGKDTIHVRAHIVGGFDQTSGSYNMPPLEVSSANDGDTYNPPWELWLDHAFAIGAGASAGPNGAVGFQNWVIKSDGAKSVGSMNIISLSGEGSTSAQTITLTDDGSPTMLFASYISDGTSADWSNIATIDLSGTTGNVVITGAETDINKTVTEGTPFSNDGGGLLTSDTSALVTIVGGAGNSFYDLSSLTLAAAGNSKASFQGGTSTKGNSEIAFNNAVVANATTANLAGTTINIKNIQVLDDTGNPTGGLINGQGGIINMNDFATLLALNVNYDLLSGPLGNLFTKSAGSIFQNATFAAGTDVAPAGYQLLQLLNGDGSTENYLSTDLSILNGFTQMAVNMIDVWDGSLTAPKDSALPNAYYQMFHVQAPTNTVHYAASYTIGNDVIVPNGWPNGAPSTGPYGTIYPAGDKAYFVNTYWDLYTAPLETLTGHNITIVQTSPVTIVNLQSHLKLWLADDGVNVYALPTLAPAVAALNGTPPAPGALVGTIFDAAQVTIDNYTTADIYLPFESVAGTQNWVVLGSQQPNNANGNVGGFNDTPVVSVPLVNNPSAVVNFYDNTVDTGGSPPGGADNLVLGFTNFTADLAPWTPTAYFDPTGSIGYTTVAIDATTTTTINDFGHGSLEIGATNATNLNAQSTSHLIMDLPGVPQYIGTNGISAALGITVNGSLTGQNLIQGSLGVNDFDTNGFTNVLGLPFFVPFDNGFNGGPGTLGVGGHVPPANSPINSGIPGYGNGVLIGESPLQLFHVGNDVLTGGGVNLAAGDVSAVYDPSSQLNGALGNAVGNTGDNFFPEGGKDIVNLAPDHGGTGVYDTVWFGMIDVSSTVDSTGVTPHYLYGQAITDIVQGVETYVDAYGPGVTNAGTTPTGGAVGVTGSNTSILTINGFNEGHTATSGDVVMFDPQSWAQDGLIIGGVPYVDLGLVNALTGLPVWSSVVAHNATETYVGTSAQAGGNLTESTEIVLDGIQAYQNAGQLVTALTHNGGDIGGLFLSAHSVEHILVAYQNSVTGGVTIDDVKITNTNNFNLFGHAGETSAAGVLVSAVDIVNLVGTAANPVTLGSLSPHDIQFVHG